MTHHLTSPGAQFLRLHQAERGFLMPNAWDAGSAIILASEGFAAIGTTSAGIAFSLGKPDQGLHGSHCAVTRDEMLQRIRQITAAMSVPVNADLEAGYGPTPADVAATVWLAIEAGAAGGNIEDYNAAQGGLFDESEAVDRLRAAHAAIQQSGQPFVLNARTDAVLCGGGSSLDAAITRANLYLAAGADCVFIPGIADAARARTLCREITGPLNLVMGLNEASSNAGALLDAGVKRISVGGSIARAALGLVRDAARELRQTGTVGYGERQIPQGELNALFERAQTKTPRGEPGGAF